MPWENVSNFFAVQASEFHPQRIYRAKTRGRFDSSDQLKFVDIGLMPLVEGEIGEAIGRLVERTVRQMRDDINLPQVTPAFGKWLFQCVFWLIAGKILKDKDVPRFRNAELSDPLDVFRLVSRHYDAVPIPIPIEGGLDALRRAAATIKDFSPLNNITTESLAYVYENTLVSRTTRAKLGTHSTPAWLVDYVLWRMTPWIEQIDPHLRHVFEPASGHSAFLVAALRTLRELHPGDMNEAERMRYMRKRIHGIEIDDFAREIGRLSLTLADIPNPDNWDLREGDMLKGRALTELAGSANVLLANPPFESISAAEGAAYRQSNVKLTYKNKTAEVLCRCFHAMPRDGVFGVVVPQSILINKSAKQIRNDLLWGFEISEICLFPDKVFQFSDVESALLIGQKRKPTTSSLVRYRRVRERGMEAFRLRSEATFEKLTVQSSFLFRTDYVLRVPELEDIWGALAQLPHLGSVADIGRGLEYKPDGECPAGELTISDERFNKAVRGFDVLDGELEVQIHGLPALRWISISKRVLRRRGTGAVTGKPQVLWNAAPVNRGPWRLKALIDRKGRAITGQFLSVRPKHTCSLEYLWAICNSPIANAYAYAHLGKRHNLVVHMRRIPIPDISTSQVLEVSTAVKEYFAGPSRQKLLSVDSTVLRLYDLSPRHERQLLELFRGFPRKGLPFDFGDYFPLDAAPTGRLADSAHMFDTDGLVLKRLPSWWAETNRRRVELIDKQLQGSLTAVEESELERIERRMDKALNEVAPLPPMPEGNGARSSNGSERPEHRGGRGA